ncbi:MAG: hypothetical protein RPU60_12400, partial [Candidatus Sedimenticola sp. (ex Thyasira tokunagai)]
ALQPAEINQYSGLNSLAPSNFQPTQNLKKIVKTRRALRSYSVSRKKLKSAMLFGILLGSKSSG